MSMRSRLLLDIAFSVILCLAVTLIAQTTLTDFVTEKGIQKSNHEKLAGKHIEFLQEYIKTNHVKSTDAKAFNEWNEQYPYVSVLIRDEEKMCYNSFVSGSVYYDSWKGDTSYDWGSYALPEYQGVLELEDEVAMYTVGGQFYQYYYKYIRVICLGLMFLVFGISFFVLFRKYLAGIDAIRQKVNAIDEGLYDQDVHVDVSWELSQLAEQVNRMSSRIKESIDRDAKLAQEKDDFVRSIAHDIRSPLAAVIGYLEILKSGKAEPSDEKEYITKALVKANHIRSLTDYFFMIENPYANLELEEYDGNDVIASCAMEMMDFALESGFKMEYDNKISDQFRIVVDRNLIQRIMDNQNSNFIKYADKEEPIYYTMFLEDNHLTITNRNKIRQSQNKEYSLGIGLTTCKAIAARLGGSFEYEIDGDHFIQTLKLPIK
jgi:signal transduction histidine kinase